MARRNRVDRQKVAGFIMVVENDAGFWRRHIKPLMCNYYKKWRRGKFDKVKARRGIINNIIKPGITLMRREYGEPTFTMSAKEKELAARELLESWIADFKDGNYPVGCK